MAKRKFTTDVISVSGSGIFNTILQFFIGIVLARSLGPEGNGIYNYILVVPMLVSMLSRLGMKRSTIFHIGKKTYTPQELISALSYIFIITSALAIIITTVIFLSMQKPDIKIPMAILAISSIPVNIIINYASGVFIGSDNIKRYNYFQWIPSFFNLLLLTIFLIILKWSVTGALMAYLISNTIMAYYALTFIIKEFHFNLKLNLKIIKEMLQMGFSFTLAGILIKLHYRIDIILLERLSDLKEVGYYSLAVRLAEKWNGAFTVSAIISSRTAMSDDIDKLKYNILRWLKVTFLASLLACVVLYFLVPFFLPMIYGEKFIPSIVMIQAILPGILMMVLYKTLMSYYTGSGKPKILIFSVLISLVINIFLNIIFIPQYGGVGAAWATNISYTILAIILLFSFCRSLKYGIWELFSFKKEDFNLLKKLLQRIFK